MTEERTQQIFCFGEVLLRLVTTPGARLMNASTLAVHCGGAEANVASMLAQLGRRAQMVTVFPHSGLGERCLGGLRQSGVGTSKSICANGRLGLYFMEQDARGSGRILYDRAHSVFAQHADEIDWGSISSDMYWLHLSGINIALGDKPANAALLAVEAARDAGATISFDVNHRASLWKDCPENSSDLMRRIIDMSDVLFASPADLSRLLDFNFECETAGDRRRAAEAAFSAFERPSIIACTLRSFDDGRQDLTARIDSREKGYETGNATIGPVIDRIGSGDSFAAGIIDALLSEAPLELCALRGLAAAVMKHSIAGDRWIGTRDDLDGFDPFVAGDVLR